MITFDPTSIYNRTLEKLQQNPDWKVVSNNSVISALLKSNAEINAETARYAEYLFKESKWDTAQNPSSILSMANILGYRPRRKTAASGTLYISPDPKTHLVGKTISSQSFLNEKDSASWITTLTDLNINSDCIITDSKNRHFIALPTFYPKGKKYIALDIIQGMKKNISINIETIRSTATTSKLDPYLYIPVYIPDCENANTTSTRAFFRVFIGKKQGDTIDYMEYRVVDSLLFSSATDNDVEVYNDIYNRNLFYFKFNNDPTRGSTLDISRGSSSIYELRINYIETLGESGNVSNIFENFSITNVSVPGQNQKLKLYGINFDMIANGQSEESIYEIKKNAPMHYISNYTSGTKEAYIQTIQNMEFPIGDILIRPTKVQVYGSKEVDSIGNVTPITCISFTAPGLEDLTNTILSKGENPYEKIEDSLNYNLMKLKSPQDTLKFIPPKYITYSLGITCKVDRKHVSDIHQLESDIRSFVDYYYGSNSIYNNFGRNIYPTQIEADIKNYFGSTVIAPVVELEAIKKLNWFDSQRMSPKSETSGQSIIIKTIRIPFSFNPVFLGKLTPRGFKDYKVSAGYVMRIDVLYKKPKILSQGMDYNVSIFIEDSYKLREFKLDPKDSQVYDTRAFYLKKDLQNASVWPETFDKNNKDYNLSEISQLTSSQQYYFKDYILTDNDYRNLIQNTSQSSSSTISSHKISPGAIDDYLVYFSADYEDEDDGSDIANGWIELTFDPLYETLTRFSNYDVNLRSRLQACPLSLLKCDNDQEKDVFKAFQEILNEYVDIYVSMRPYDPQLVINSASSKNNENTVLYVDSSDSLVANNTTVNLTNYKKPRMISVRCEYEE